ncbi:MAG: Hpt domain-containing protein [Spirochaetaceae bacterium]|nr:Hpt domain-containing protein [Spirochaetaceae bacterium]
MEDNETLKKYIDLDAALARVQGNKAIIKRMFGLFLQNNLFADFENALSQSDYLKASEVAHGIKGMAGNLGMTILADESSKLMIQMRAGEVPDEQILKNYREILVKTRDYTEKVIEQLTP